MGPTPENTRPGAGLLLRRFSLVSGLIALDLWSKSAVFAWLSGSTADLVRDSCGHLRMHVLGPDIGWFTFMLSRNPGAAFGQFSGFPHILVGLRVVAVIALCVMVIRAKTGKGWFTAALMLVLAGALGNLYDNLALMNPGDGHPYGMVRDFIDVYFVTWKKHFPTFNVADSCISVGAAILLIGSFFKEPEPAEEPLKSSDSGLGVESL